MRHAFNERGAKFFFLAPALCIAVASAAGAQLEGVLDKAKEAGVDTGAGVGATAPAATVPASGGLVAMLTQQLGVTEPQATGGAGAIFALAKSKLGAGDFSQIAAGVPNMDALLGAAPTPAAPAEADTGAAGGLAGSALGAMGGSGALGSAAQLASSFSSLGLGPDMVGKFIPVVVQYVQGTAGPGAASLLQGAVQ
jgi:hypothetical protein